MIGGTLSALSAAASRGPLAAPLALGPIPLSSVSFALLRPKVRPQPAFQLAEAPSSSDTDAARKSEAGPAASGVPSTAYLPRSAPNASARDAPLSGGAPPSADGPNGADGRVLISEVDVAGVSEELRQTALKELQAREFVEALSDKFCPIFLLLPHAWVLTLGSVYIKLPNEKHCADAPELCVLGPGHSVGPGPAGRDGSFSGGAHCGRRHP